MIRKKKYRLPALVIITFLLLVPFPGKAGPGPANPGYDPSNGDHRFSQMLKGIIRLGGGGFLLTGLGGVYYYRDVFSDPNDSFFSAEPAAVAATTVGFFGSLLGGVYGYFTGLEYNEKEQADTAFHAPQDNLGARILFVFANYPRFHLIYNLRNVSLLMPDEVRLGFAYRFRSGIPVGPFLWNKDKADFDDTFLALERRWEGGVINHLHLKGGNVVPYYGVNLGYARARDCAEDMPDDFKVNKEVRSVFAQLITGVQLNILDYVHLEAELAYEPFGVHQALKELHDYHYSGNFEFNIYIGSYMFKVGGKYKP